MHPLCPEVGSLWLLGGKLSVLVSSQLTIALLSSN